MLKLWTLDVKKEESNQNAQWKKKAVLHKRLFSAILFNKILLLKYFYQLSVVSQNEIVLINLCLVM